MPEPLVPGIGRLEEDACTVAGLPAPGLPLLMQPHEAHHIACLAANNSKHGASIVVRRAVRDLADSNQRE